MDYIQTSSIKVDSIPRDTIINRHGFTITEEMIEDRAFDIGIFNQYNDEWMNKALDFLVEDVKKGEAPQRIIDTIYTFASDYYARKIAIDELNTLRDSVSEF